MYDPDRRPSQKDGGCWCPVCRTNLLFGKIDTAPHWSGDGLAYECPKCGEPLHENQHCYTFSDNPEQSLPAPRSLKVTVRPHAELNPNGDPDKPWEVVEE